MARSPPRGLAVLGCLALLAAAASATQFRVGGEKGWSVPGAGDEPYNSWAGRMRFQIGDQLLFVYPKGADSVLLVEPAAYNACNTSAYDKKFDDGSTVFTFDRSGPFFFVSGNEANCRANQKLVVVVLADRSGGSGTPPSTTPPPSAAPLPSPMSPPPSATPMPTPSSPMPSPSSPPSSAPPAATPSSAPSPAGSAPGATPTSSPPSPAAMAPSPSSTPGGGGGASQPPSAGSAGAPGSDGGGSATPTPPSSSNDQNSAAAPVVAGFVGSLGAYITYAMLAI